MHFHLLVIRSSNTLTQVHDIAMDMYLSLIAKIDLKTVQLGELTEELSVTLLAALRHTMANVHSLENDLAVQGCILPVSTRVSITYLGCS